MNGVRTTLFLWCRKSSTSLAGMSQPLNGERLTSVSNGYFDQLLDEISCGLRIQQAPSFNHFSGPPPHSGAWASVISQAPTPGPNVHAWLLLTPASWIGSFVFYYRWSCCTGSNASASLAYWLAHPWTKSTHAKTGQKQPNKNRRYNEASLTWIPTSKSIY